MHMPSIWGILIVAVLVFIFFGGKGKLSGAMEDLAKGIKGFKKGMADENAVPPAATPPSAPVEPPRMIQDKSQTPAQQTRESRVDVP
jgi:sec-independent protein translocase protein TatA